MNPVQLSTLAEILNAELLAEDCTISHMTHDTRKIKAGDCFIAIKGHRFDGHDYIAKAIELGATSVIAQENIPANISALKVSDTRTALSLIAKYNREQCDIPVIALTGSCGKTTTKTMLASICAQKLKTHATRGTLNNDLGVPFTLLELDKSHEVSVLELGANHMGEIDGLTQLAQPTVAMILNINPVHVEGFGSVDNIAKAKGEIYNYLAQTGTAIMPYGSRYCAQWQSTLQQQRVLTFGRDVQADVYLSNIQLNEQQQASFELRYQEHAVNIQLSILGEHNVDNAAAAAAAAIAIGFDLTTIKVGIESMQAVSGRLNISQLDGDVTLIDDSYNANPTAVKAAIDVLVAMPNSNSCLVLGEMGELGEESLRFHAEVGEYAKAKGVQYLLTIGECAQAATAAFGAHAKHYSTKKELVSALRALLQPKMVVLIKGSRSNQLEEVVQALTNNNKEFAC